MSEQVLDYQSKTQLPIQVERRFVIGSAMTMLFVGGWFLISFYIWHYHNHGYAMGSEPTIYIARDFAVIQIWEVAGLMTVCNFLWLLAKGAFNHKKDWLALLYLALSLLPIAILFLNEVFLGSCLVE